MKKAHGFTLVELMVTLAIAAIILTLGVPSFRDLIQNNRITTQSNILVGFLQNARLEAVKRNLTVHVCIDDSPSSNSCDGSNWQDGFKLWIDLNSNSAVDSNEVIRVHQGDGGSIDISEAASQSQISFDGTGAAINTATFDVCDTSRSGENGNQIDISNTGRVSSNAITCS